MLYHISPALRSPMDPCFTSASNMSKRSVPSQGEKKSATSSSVISSKSSKSSSISSPSAGASTAHGYDVTNYKLRSVLAHPLGLPLAALLNTKTVSQEFQLYSELDCQDELNQLDLIFSKAANEWNGQTEVDLTNALLTKINESLPAEGEKQVYGRDANGDDRRGRIDILIGRDTSTENSRPVLTVLEVGLGSTEWWRKLDQGITYVELLADWKKGEHCFSKPMLLAVITPEKVEVSESIDQLKARFGVFLYTRKDSHTKNFRMSLLWREDTNGLKAASTAFGKLLRATCACGKWRDESPRLEYHYLGPNCCSFGKEEKMVLRSYDTRLRATQRRPFLYLEEEKGGSVIFPGENVAQKVLTIDDSGKDVLDFGNSQSDSEDTTLHRRDWLWEFRGKLLVIATPYRVGRHYATKPTDFLPIIEHLERLHKLGYVHGDIRAFNMVLGRSAEASEEAVDAALGTSGDTDGGVSAKHSSNLIVRRSATATADSGFDANKGSLIDFDFGGKQGATNYPQGYQPNLPDGNRIGAEGEVIEYKHDWYALGSVIFDYHMFPLPQKAKDLAALALKQVTAQQRLQGGNILPRDIVNLKEYLRDAEGAGYSVERKPAFARCFEKLSKQGTPMQGTAMATGSPPKPKGA